MIDRGKHSILGVPISAVDYEAAVVAVIEAARGQRTLGVAALAVHGVMISVSDPDYRCRLNQLDMVVPDGMPVRWGLNLLHRADLPDRVYGPNLTLYVCEAAAGHGLPIYLYGSQPSVLDDLAANLRDRFPQLQIAGMKPSAFRQVTAEEQAEIAGEIRASGARIVLVGLGCPRQETWVYEHLGLLDMPMLAVGAAFDFHAGSLPQAPAWMQRRGLEWLFRLIQEPRRLWRRYALNPLYLLLLGLQWIGLYRVPLPDDDDSVEPLRYG